MKTLFLFLFTMLSFPLFAADLVVEEFGVAPAYAGIQVAIDAAAPGDRILIKNRPGAIPWFENLTINKNIELLSYENDSSFAMQGDITIIPNNITVTIVGMVNLRGNINRSNAAGNARSSVVNIIDCKITGSIDLDTYRVVANIVGNTIHNGTVELIHGKIIGNDFTESTISIFSSGTYNTENFLIIGNKISSPSISTNDVLSVECDHYNFHIKNNFIRSRAGRDALYLRKGNNSNLIHYVYNNTIKIRGGSSRVALVIDGGTAGNYWSSTVEIMNNVLEVYNSTAALGIYIFPNNSLPGSFNVYYNYVDDAFSSTITNHPSMVSFNNNTTTSFGISANTGALPTSHPGIDGANPGPAFYDLDLSKGDAGCYGGSYTLDNFFPLHTGAARVYMVTYPFNVRQGSTLNINADAYDR